MAGPAAVWNNLPSSNNTLKFGDEFLQADIEKHSVQFTIMIKTSIIIMIWV
jgi:hypothetical protein